MDEEIWKPVVGFEGWYDVSNRGRIRRLYNGGEDGWRILKPSINQTGTGYYQVSLSKNGKVQRNTLVHIVVAEAFNGPRPPGLLVLHRNGKSLECNEGNLYYGTHQQNMADRVTHGTSNRGQRHGMSRLTNAQAADIRARYKPGMGPALSREFGVSKQTITRIVAGTTWQYAA